MKIKNSTTNKIYQGNCLEKMRKLPSKSVDLIFADPPYNLQLKKDLKRPDYTNVNGVKENWDKFKQSKSVMKASKGREFQQMMRRIMKE